jgi:DMSO/TMAO reductase YedYZ molybdopterin-dependent catalytic subunit
MLRYSTYILILLLVFIPDLFSGGNSEADAASGKASAGEQGVSEEEAGYLDLFEGLHITGTPIDIDPDTYRLTVSGAVDRELSLSLEEIKSYEAVEIHADLVCPGFFTDSGSWTGVPVQVLLDEAGVDEDARRVIFKTVDDSYTSQIAVGELDPEEVLIAYHYNNEEFHRLHGYPLRLVAKGYPGNVWVKWLGKLIVE